MKKVLITGAGSGLGLGSALGLAKAGHDVFATVRRADHVPELQTTVVKLGLQDRVTVEKASEEPSAGFVQRETV